MMEHGRKWLHPHLADDIRKDVAEWRRLQAQRLIDEQSAEYVEKQAAIIEAERIMGLR